MVSVRGLPPCLCAAGVALVRLGVVTRSFSGRILRLAFDKARRVNDCECLSDAHYWRDRCPTQTGIAHKGLPSGREAGNRELRSCQTVGKLRRRTGRPRVGRMVIAGIGNREAVTDTDD